MSTRATYRFFDSKDSFAPDTTVYIHYDGYPAGAAVYFLAMLASKNGSHGRPRGCLATRFIVANAKHAELTKSHDAHVDTEYRYTLDANGRDEYSGIAKDAQIKVEEVIWGEDWNYDNTTSLLFEGSLYEFIVNNLDVETAVAWLKGTVTKRDVNRYYNMCLRLSRS